jgi:hypothetical protein
MKFSTLALSCQLPVLGEAFELEERVLVVGERAVRVDPLAEAL